jgi:hypothetical protein
MATTTTDEFFSISKFRETLGTGARANLFRCSITAPTGLGDTAGIFGADNKFSFLCRSAAIPAMSVGVIEVPFRGRRIKVPGDRTFTDWTVTVINDEKQDMRKIMDNWMKFIVNPDGELALRASTDDYRSTIKINHFRGDGTTSRIYALFNAFPTDVSAIDLSYDTTDAIQEFTVTFQYTHMDMGGTSESGNATGPASISASEPTSITTE